MRFAIRTKPVDWERIGDRPEEADEIVLKKMSVAEMHNVMQSMPKKHGESVDLPPKTVAAILYYGLCRKSDNKPLWNSPEEAMKNLTNIPVSVATRLVEQIFEFNIDSPEDIASDF